MKLVNGGFRLEVTITTLFFLIIRSPGVPEGEVHSKDRKVMHRLGRIQSCCIQEV